jgi:hypothetical protein
MTRYLLLLLALAVSACSTPAGKTPAQIAAQDAADAKTILIGLTSLDGAITSTPGIKISSGTATAISQGLANVTSAVSTFDANVVPTTTQVQAFESAVNGALSTFAASGLVPPQYQFYLTAAAALLPVIEQTVTTTVAGLSAADPTAAARNRALLLTKPRR